MSAEEHRHVALPKLYGGPAYARPTVLVASTTPRPFNPDDLPLVVAMTDEERDAIEHRAFQPEVIVPVAMPGLTGRPFSLRALSDRLRNARG